MNFVDLGPVADQAVHPQREARDVHQKEGQVHHREVGLPERQVILGPAVWMAGLLPQRLPTPVATAAWRLWKLFREAIC